MSAIDEDNDVFISYQWDIKPQVKEICEELKKHFKIWRDDDDMRHNNETLSQQLANAIRKSKVVLCFFTQKYALSKNCKREIKYSFEYDKSIIILDIEKIDKKTLDKDIGFLITDLVRINCYHNPTNWVNEKLEEIVKAIKNNLEEYEKKDPKIKNLIAGRFKMIKQLGKGAQSTVYLVEDYQNNNKIEALKKFNNQPLSEQVIENEVNLTKNLKHKNIIRYYGFHSIEKFDDFDGKFIIHMMLMEYYEDGSLDEKIKLHKINNLEFDYHQKISWCIQLLEAISYLHGHNIIHRDIKPSNIFLSRDSNHLVLGDLGHAKRIEIEKTKSYESISSERLFGTISYNAPELICNKYIPNLQKMSDIWSFGCTVYEIQQLKSLFYDENIQFVVDRIINFDFTKLDLNDEEPIMNHLIQMSLIMEPENRADTKKLILVSKGIFNHEEFFSTRLKRSTQNSLIHVSEFSKNNEDSTIKNEDNKNGNNVKTELPNENSNIQNNDDEKQEDENLRNVIKDLIDNTKLSVKDEINEAMISYKSDVEPQVKEICDKLSDNFKKLKF